MRPNAPPGSPHPPRHPAPHPYATGKAMDATGHRPVVGGLGSEAVMVGDGFGVAIPMSMSGAPPHPLRLLGALEPPLEPFSAGVCSPLSSSPPQVVPDINGGLGGGRSDLRPSFMVGLPPSSLSASSSSSSLLMAQATLDRARGDALLRPSMLYSDLDLTDQPSAFGDGPVMPTALPQQASGTLGCHATAAPPLQPSPFAPAGPYALDTDLDPAAAGGGGGDVGLDPTLASLRVAAAALSPAADQMLQGMRALHEQPFTVGLKPFRGRPAQRAPQHLAPSLVVRQKAFRPKETLTFRLRGGAAFGTGIAVPCRVQLEAQDATTGQYLTLQEHQGRLEAGDTEMSFALKQRPVTRLTPNGKKRRTRLKNVRLAIECKQQPAGAGAAAAAPATLWWYYTIPICQKALKAKPQAAPPPPTASAKAPGKSATRTRRSFFLPGGGASASAPSGQELVHRAILPADFGPRKLAALTQALREVTEEFLSGKRGSIQLDCVVAPGREDEFRRILKDQGATLMEDVQPCYRSPRMCHGEVLFQVHVSQVCLQDMDVMISLAQHFEDAMVSVDGVRATSFIGFDTAPSPILEFAVTSDGQRPVQALVADFKRELRLYVTATEPRADEWFKKFSKDYGRRMSQHAGSAAEALDATEPASERARFSPIGDDDFRKWYAELAEGNRQLTGKIRAQPQAGAKAQTTPAGPRGGKKARRAQAAPQEAVRRKGKRSSRAWGLSRKKAPSCVPRQ